MKKVLFILITVLTLGTVSHAQGRAYIQGTVATQSGLFSQGLEIGALKDKDRVGIVGETYERNYADRQYFVGLKYARALQQGEVIDFFVTGQALAHIQREVALSVEPGAELNVKLGHSGVAFVAAISSPLYQDEKPFGSGLNLKGALGLQARF